MTTWLSCPYCQAYSFGSPPHGDAQPCPLKVRVDEAYIERLAAERDSTDAQRAMFEGQGVHLADIAIATKRMLEKMIGDDE